MKWISHSALIVIFFSTLSACPTLAATIRVPVDQPTIQAGIDAATDGDLVSVGPGIYNETIDLLGKAIEVKSIGGALLTTIDGSRGGSVVTFSSDESLETIINGFTIMKGSGTLHGMGSAGGGIYCSYSSPTIRNCIILLNVACGFDFNYGGGIFCEFSSPSITNCKIIGNDACAGYREGGMGGGMFCLGGAPTIEDCEFICNVTDMWEMFKGEGAGLACSDSNLTLDNCTFIGNLFSYDGGAIYCMYSSPLIINCTASLNMAVGEGGGFYFYSSSPRIENTTVTNNYSGNEGGGIYSSDSTVSINKCMISSNSARDGGGISCLFPSVTMENCVISNNEAWDGRGGGVRFEGYSVSPLIIIHSTITGNYASVIGGGIYYDRDEPLTIANCIVWENSAPAYPDIFGVSTVTYSDVTGGWPGIGNIDANPRFVSPWDHHLSPDSPCINAGTATCVHEDIDGQFRSWGSGFDMGADEYSLMPSCSTIAATGNQFMALFMIPVLALIFLRQRFLRR